MRHLAPQTVWALPFLLAVAASGRWSGAEQPPAAPPADEYASTIRPLLQKYCLGCHSAKAKKGSLDLERFATPADIRKDVKPWQGMIEQIEAGEMPPKEKPQPTAEEKKKLIAWVKGFLDAEARARVGDPGHVPLRRLSNAEYDYTVRDLTGVDLRPAREFPADGAAGEGFTNAAEALTDISPALFTKYLNAAKDIADHAVLLPDGVRFSAGKTRRDWTDEATAKLRAFYGGFAPDGKLNITPYLTATVRHRDDLLSGKVTVAEIATKEKLNAKYLGVLWATLTDKTPSYPLDAIRARWSKATEKDVPALAAAIAAWQTAVWRFVQIGSYRNEQTVRQLPNDPQAVEAQTLRLAVKPAPGQSDVVLYLAARDAAGGAVGRVLWQRPRLEAAGQPARLLRDYPRFGPPHEFDFAALFGDTPKYLAAVAEAAHEPKRPAGELAKKHGLDAAFLARWIDVLALQPGKDDGFTKPLRTIPAGALTLLEDPLPKDDNQPAINGWRKKGTDLPVAVANSSDRIERIPGTVRPHAVAVHPMPQEYVAAAWTSPVDTSVTIAATVTHAHPACGNGVAWRVEHRRGGRAGVLAEGVADLGKEAKAPATTAKVAKGDVLLLVVDARDGSHVCDMTGIAFSVTETGKPARVWDLAKDVADSILAGNPHADSLGNTGVWSFVRGATVPGGTVKGGPVIPPDSALGRWRAVALDPAKAGDATTLAEQVRALLTGPRPAQEKSADRALFDNLASVESPLLAGLELGKLGKARSGVAFGLPADRFDGANVPAEVNTVTEVRLPAALFGGREFVVEGRLAPGNDGAALFQASAASPAATSPWDGKSPVVASPAGHKRFVAGLDAFRRVFPQFVCFQQVIPTDEVVSLKMFHREDEPLIRLFLDEKQTQHLNRLWAEHRFVSRQPVAENDYLPQFIGYVTQDQPKELLAYFESQRPVFQKRADEFTRDVEAAIPKQLDALLAFAERAYRRPLAEKEKAELLALYQAVRTKGAGHEEAVRGVLARVLVAPAFLFRIEQPPAGKKPGPVTDWELATRLSYFLWASPPDEELRRLAAAGTLRNPRVLAEQTTRMLADPRTRALAVEFGTQWLHVRGFDEFKEKNEALFPSFDAKLRAAIYEESIRFFLDFFQSDRPVSHLLDADATFLNEPLAKHYGIPGVSGPEWRRVGGVRKYGRGGILGLASVQAKQSGASRTSPVLRGNWVVETLLGEKLPKPPPNVPQLPEQEGADRLTTRQQVERHAKDPACAVCHVRIDPFGFALEKYDTIGRLREKDLGGLAVDTRAKLKDGTEFEGIDGLRTYLLAKKKDVIVRLFCRKLLGYALGRAVTLSDTALVDEMVAGLNKSGGVSAAIQAVVRSPQFRLVRGAAFGE